MTTKGNPTGKRYHGICWYAHCTRVFPSLVDFNVSDGSEKSLVLNTKQCRLLVSSWGVETIFQSSSKASKKSWRRSDSALAI